MKNKKVSKNNDWGTLLIIIVIIEGLAFIANIFNKGSGRYYEILRKPFFALPSVILIIFWPVVLLSISIAAYLFISKNREGVYNRRGVFYFIVQVTLNFLWPFIFFRLNLYGISFLLSLLIILTTVLTTIKFLKGYKAAGLLMLPYIILVTYSSILNYYIWLLNEA
ncbi:MAG: tryptophan-rich sensory protein [Clostridiales bacterium]|uniref:TspO/MBR family protein n=1 Tax=Clostridium sp. N3C TaxID=1776758 RepID=UPI00092DEFC1|nr:TspO/MBR family protein [Clostridium sp. N3C]NLZ48225.1 tryptophan-rich sensory protein [Clostridiales bacterium]SCN22236.1 TspO/MBR family protein [Clostridium sp. N3C]